MIEARRGAELFGSERLDALLAERAGQPAQEIADAVVTACRAYRGRRARRRLRDRRDQEDVNLRRRDGPPLVVGHRGAAAVAPENTLAALQVAVDAGAHLVEFDIGPDLQLAHSRREVPEDSLSLDDALAFLAEHEIGVHLDVKLPGYEQDVVDAIERHALDERALVSTAFSRSSQAAGGDRARRCHARSAIRATVSASHGSPGPPA